MQYLLNESRDEWALFSSALVIYRSLCSMARMRLSSSRGPVSTPDTVGGGPKSEVPALGGLLTAIGPVCARVCVHPTTAHSFLSLSAQKDSASPMGADQRLPGSWWLSLTENHMMERSFPRH